MSAPSVVLVTGSRALVGNDEARAWLRERLGALCPTIVVSGRAKGPDSWAAEWAAESNPTTGVRSVLYDGTGVIYVNGQRGGLWTKAAAPQSPDRAAWRAQFLKRDRVMVGHVAQRAGELGALVVALYSTQSATQGTAYTVRHARAAGLPVEERTWSPRGGAA